MVLSFVNRVNAACMGRPFSTGLLIAGTKTCAMDLFVQVGIEKKGEIDLQRNAVFTAFGLGYLGGVQYFIYSYCYKHWLPGKTAVDVAYRLFFDQFVHSPLLYFPCFYILQDAMMTQRLSLECASDACRRYWVNMSEDLVEYWKVWFPTQLINFWLVPTHWRVPYVAGISLVWSCILSNMRGSFDDEVPAAAPAASPVANLDLPRLADMVVMVE